MLRKRVIDIMEKYYNGDLGQINHTLEVLKYAEKICEEENLTFPYLKNVIICSSVFHDIGIPEARRKYNSTAPKYQELEGPSVARHLMDILDIRKDIIERVCYIVGNHHTFSSIDGIDFQILFESDMIVNLREGWQGLDKADLKEKLESGSFTKSGAELIRNLL